MSRIADYPPLRNESAPPIDGKVRSALSSINRIDGQFPAFRLVWGQWYEVGYVYAGEWHLTYRHHVERRKKLGEPEYDLENNFIGWKNIYDLTDVLPAIPLIALEECEDIGINRWFIELAEPVDLEEWNATRYLDETGQVRLGEDGNPLDFAGEPPDGLISYSELYCVARHDEDCCNKTHLTEDKKRCYGHYRAPSMRDVEICRASFQEMLEKRNPSYGFRDKVPVGVLMNRTIAAFKQHDANDEKRRAAIEDELTQILSPHTKRLADGIGQELSGLDKFKYSDLGSTLATLRANKNNPKAYKGKKDKKCKNT